MNCARTQSDIIAIAAKIASTPALAGLQEEDGRGT
jgi:hypothetical protein